MPLETDGQTATSTEWSFYGVFLPLSRAQGKGLAASGSSLPALLDIAAGSLGRNERRRHLQCRH